jgi:hypothetical protein
MGIIYEKEPIFLAKCTADIKFHKLMFIKKGGKAISKIGDLTRNYYDTELICISNENEKNWIGNYAEGSGFFGVEFRKEDCREATADEVKQWIKNPKSIKF